MSVLEAPVSVFHASDAWAVYHATLEFTGRLIGGAPSDPELVEGWLKKTAGITDEEQLRGWTRKHLAEVHGLDVASASDQDIEQAISAAAVERKAQVFKRTPAGEPYVEGRHVKAMLKEATNIAYPKGANKWGQYASRSVARAGQAVGGKAPVDFLAERVFVPEQPIVVASDVTGVDLAVGHLEDQYGNRRSTIGYFEYVEGAVITVEVRALDDCVSPDQWARIWTVAEHNGLGARRSQGAGQFVVTAWEGAD